MKGLIEALQIFSKYSKCENDEVGRTEIMTVNISPSIVSAEDRDRLKELWFYADNRLDNFFSPKY